MSTDRTPGKGMRRILSLAAFVAGALVLLTMPLAMLYFAVGNQQDAHLPGTLVIVSAAAGMGLVGIGAVLRD